MLSAASFVLCGICLVAATHANSLVPSWDLDLGRRPISDSTRQLLRRYDHVDTDTSKVDVGSLLYVNATIGTPPQQLQFLIDIFGPLTSCLSSTYKICQNTSGCPQGSFDATTSSTYKMIDKSFDFNYTDGTYDAGLFAQDTLSIGGTSVSGFQFGLVNDSTSNTNALGLGYPKLDPVTNPYPNLPSRLTSDGNIPLTAYSMWFDGKDFNTGKLAFGGVDTGKFSGTLGSLQIESLLHLDTDNSTVKYSSPSLATDNLYATIDGKQTLMPNSSAHATITSTASGLFLPYGMLSWVANSLGATYFSGSNVLAQAYDLMKNDTVIGVTLAGVSIEIPLVHLVSPGNATWGAIFLGHNDLDGTIILGVPFLRSTYLVIDYTNNQVSLQQTVYNNASNVTIMPATGVQGLRSTLNISSSSSHPPTHNDKSKKIGIGIGVGIGVPLLLAVLAGLFLWRRRKHQRIRTHEHETLEVQDAGAEGKFDKSRSVTAPGTETRFEKSELPATRAQIPEFPTNTPRSKYRDTYGNHISELPGSLPSQFELSSSGSLSGSNLKSSDTIERYGR